MPRDHVGEGYNAWCQRGAIGGATRRDGARQCQRTDCQRATGACIDEVVSLLARIKPAVRCHRIGADIYAGSIAAKAARGYRALYQRGIGRGSVTGNGGRIAGAAAGLILPIEDHIA